MINASNISLSFGERVLFKDVNIKFTAGNCYGVIGANGAGKSTFMNILSGELEQDSGDVIITPGERLAVLRQDHFAFDDHVVLEVVLMGHKKLYPLYAERMALYAKTELTGIFLGISNDGELILLLDNGRKTKFKVEHTILENDKVQL